MPTLQALIDEDKKAEKALRESGGKFVGIPEPETRLREFMNGDARRFSFLSLWTKHEACVLVKNQVRVDTTGHYYFAPNKEAEDCKGVNLPRLKFPVNPLKFVLACERASIPLPPLLAEEVKKFALNT